MYNPNSSIPKTLVKFLVEWAARHEFEGETRDTLLDVVDTLISPELLPLGADGAVAQSTESFIGPYELHDFFLFHFLRYGAPPEKILFLAKPRPLRPRLLGRRTAPLAGRLPAPLLRQPVQALLPARRPQGRFDQPVAARRLADAERRPGRPVAAPDRGTNRAPRPGHRRNRFALTRPAAAPAKPAPRGPRAGNAVRKLQFSGKPRPIGRLPNDPGFSVLPEIRTGSTRSFPSVRGTRRTTRGRPPRRGNNPPGRRTIAAKERPPSGRPPRARPPFPASINDDSRTHP